MEFAELIKTPRVDKVVLHRPFHPPVGGTLCLTGHHLILSSRQDNSEELWLLHSNIDSIEKRFVGSTGTITIKCKDLRIIQLEITGMDECINIASSIEALSTLDSISLMYPFFYRPMFEVTEDGWHAFLPDQEFELLSLETEDWRLSHVNRDFSVCQSYPPIVIVPKSIDDESLRKVAAFRQGGRFPVLSYYHRKNGMVMMRSSQPLTGTNNRRCKEDEKLINATLRPGKRGYIIDTRSLNVAQQARARGGGFEQEANYPQWRRIHKSIESSQEEMLTPSFLGGFWADQAKPRHYSIAKCFYLSNITDLCLQAGHPFQHRCAQSAYSNSKQKWEAPTFLLFLDCVWQILRQFPCSFQFNERFLVTLFEQAYASQFGTFLCNNEYERSKLKLQQKTLSLWSWMNQPTELHKFTNPLFEANGLVIWPSVAPQSLQLWEGVFLRWNRPTKYLEDAYEEMIHIIEYNKELQVKVNALRRQLAELETEDGMLETP
ncbi:myotubularin-related protein 9 [Pyxicephalus adspersus]|uniref:myotubularin-related protein 9 n=1 Tax=Pyxicephalus adspersus TaxID=30357 RepID=UPI003B59D4F4